MTDSFISIEGIAKRYPAPSGTTTIFENLWLPMQRGEFVCVIGHSGCGKTTVLNILAGLDTPSEGAVIVDGQAIEGPSLDRAVIFQGHSLLPWRSVMGNVAYAVTSKWRKWSTAQVQKQAQTFIDLVGLTSAEVARAGRALPAGMLGRHWIGHERHNTEYVLSQEPELIVFGTKYGSAPLHDISQMRAGFYAEWLLLDLAKAGKIPYEPYSPEIVPGVYWHMLRRRR